MYHYHGGKNLVGTQHTPSLFALSSQRGKSKAIMYGTVDVEVWEDKGGE